MNEPAYHYRADITAGALKLPETRVIADLLLSHVDAEGWNEAIVTKNVLQTRTPATAKRLTQLIRGRLELMGPDIWALVRDAKGEVATQAVFASDVPALKALTIRLRNGELGCIIRGRVHAAGMGFFLGGQ